MTSIFRGYDGTQYRVRFYPPFGCIVFYIRNLILLGLTPKKHNSTGVGQDDLGLWTELKDAPVKSFRPGHTTMGY